jgi:hypothetical protein
LKVGLVRSSKSRYFILAADWSLLLVPPAGSVCWLGANSFLSLKIMGLE